MGKEAAAKPSSAKTSTASRFDQERRRRLSQDGKVLFRHAVSHEIVPEECRSVEEVSNITTRDLESMGSELDSFDEWKTSQEETTQKKRENERNPGDASTLRTTIAMKRRAQNAFVYSG
ncbi:hypothetical protein Ae201684P_008418 [Aphanomyces euteiches]|uniref:Uncharacterized protein n=1 Tax=Aphanomyces euteiches TaxID=100861 RepID=A0A6G0XPN2_9STRA|nr:hypothetical protein Ae201684_002873 [Aphanomyces euteiches]KAH9092749.1 hypothetical protein Ae201684P_008418 [Aphanomyces euteiches]KAH9155211.1 hypothetical protein AeRB84_002816 [Aphanomyces euteiches]